MKTLKGILIYPPPQLMEIETPRPDGSLGLLYLASSLEKAGIKTDILDASVGPSEQTLEETFYKKQKQSNGLIKIGMSFSEIAEYVKKGEYDFVGINSNFTPQMRMAVETAKAIKQINPDIKIYAGGTNARALKEKFLETGFFDAICLTEGEFIFSKMILKGYQNIPGVAYIENGKIVSNPIDKSCFPKDLDDLPMPAFEKIPFDKYEQISSAHGVNVTGKELGRYAPIMTSRGCVFGCSYCHNSTTKQTIGRLRLHSIERIIKELDKLKALGVKKVFFEDDSLFAKKDRAKKLFKLIREKGFTIMNVNGVNLIDFYNPWESTEDGFWKIDHDFINILKNAGFEQLVFPAESGSQRILQKYAGNKVNLAKMDLQLLMKSLIQQGIKAPVNMMIGFPDETEEEMQESIDLAKKLMHAGAPYVTFFIPIPFPGSKLYDIALQNNNLDLSFDPDIMNWKQIVMKNTHVSPERIKELRDKATQEVNTKEHVERRYKDSVGYGL